jgi:beta-glucosidase
LPKWPILTREIAVYETVDVRADPRTLHEVYLRHFKRVVDEGVASIMTAYNSVNGEWARQNKALLTDILQTPWGFQGYVQTDWVWGMRDAKTAALVGSTSRCRWRTSSTASCPTW